MTPNLSLSTSTRNSVGLKRALPTAHNSLQLSVQNGFCSAHIGQAIGDGSPEQYEAAVRELKSLRMEKAGVVREAH